MAARLGGQYYVGPDNGTLTLLLDRYASLGAETVFYHLDRPNYWLPEISHVFHGRDIFAPTAAHLAAGVPIWQLGTRFEDPVRLDLPRPERTAHGLRGQIIHIDHFGNLASNIRVEHFQPLPGVTVSLAGVVINDLVATFGERPPGSLVALFGSTGNLIVSVVNGSAAERLQARAGDSIEVSLPA
jgi:hypothetical protein